MDVDIYIMLNNFILNSELSLFRRRKKMRKLLFFSQDKEEISICYRRRSCKYILGHSSDARLATIEISTCRNRDSQTAEVGDVHA